LASWDDSAQGFPNQCTFPQQQFGPASQQLFGQCQFTDVSKAQLAMSDEVLAVAAARSNNLPIRSGIVQVGLVGLRVFLVDIAPCYFYQGRAVPAEALCCAAIGQASILRDASK
jgi:hypothetical protein